MNIIVVMIEVIMRKFMAQYKSSLAFILQAMK